MRNDEFINADHGGLRLKADTGKRTPLSAQAFLAGFRNQLFYRRTLEVIK